MTPCVAMWQNSGLGTLQFTVDPKKSIPGHRSLAGRIQALTQCRGLDLWMVHRGHFIKPNVTHYFARAHLGEWYKEPYNWLAAEMTDVEAMIKGVVAWKGFKRSGGEACFYLGKFPVYWDASRWSMVFADEMVAGGSFAVGQRPFIVGVNMDFFEALDPGRRSIYFGDDVIRSYARQMEFFNYWRGWQKRCIADNYEREPFRKRYVKGTKMEWPGWPMSDIERPNPENMKPPEVYPPERELPLPMPVKLRLVVRLRQTYSPKADKLFLDMDL